MKHDRSSFRRGRTLLRLTGLFLLVVAGAIGRTDVVWSQVRIPAEAHTSEAQLQQVLQRGQNLEAEHRWAEALAHYEQAIREYPDRRDLWDRMTRARRRYDLLRRYDDRSFTNWVAELSEQESRGLYSEVLRKIESHYVRQPDWQSLAQRGLDNLITGLQNASFVQQHCPQTAPEKIREFCDETQRRMGVTKIGSQRDTVDVAATVAKLAQQQLGVPPAATFLEYTCGATCSLDQYSCFLTRGQLEDVFSQIEGNFVGLGIELKASEQALEIVGVIPGGPAAEGKINVGDRIVQVDGTSMAQVTADEAADLLKGLDGTAVTLSLLDRQDNPRQLRLVRRLVEVPSIERARIVDSDYGIAYLRLASFQKTTSRDFDAALWQLHRQGMRLLVVDVRGNPGGLLTAAVEVADKFVSAGGIVSTRGRNAHEDFDYDAHSVGTWRVPLIVLIDGDTASASEIFAGAIQDNQRGKIIGERSYGKGSVQGIFSLNTTRAGVRLTTAKFYSPNGQAISNQGVAPDLPVHSVQKPANGDTASSSVETDQVLATAVDYARSNVLGQRHAQMP